MDTYIAYHYSDSKISKFDSSKCDGLWFTDIEPSDNELLDGIGANGLSYCHKCEITINNDYDDGSNGQIDTYDCKENLINNNADGAILNYDGFTDYVVLSSKQVTILEVTETNQ